MRVGLHPLTTIAMVNVVAVHGLQAALQIRSSQVEPRVVPVFLDTQGFATLHGIDDTPLVVVPSLSYGPDEPVTNRRARADLRFASSQSTECEECIWGKAKITRNNIKIKLHQQLY